MIDLLRQEPYSRFAIDLDFLEVDVLRDPVTHDLLDASARFQHLEDIFEGRVHITIVTPPCNTHSRAPFSGLPGPAPLRSAEHPHGLPNLSASIVRW